MNKHCFRIVFNARRGQLMAVAEITAAAGQGAAGERRVAGCGTGLALRAALKPLAHGVMLALGLMLPGASGLAWAQVVADPGAAATLRPTVLQTANGLPQVNIQTPNAAGLSRNAYSQFDVTQRGLIVNNSRSGAATMLAGQVPANPWLATGSARVILNEVNSSAPSQLKGYIEVAGAKADLIIANPSGIVANGAGFINAGRATLSTGVPVFNGAALSGWQVSQGGIVIEGLGLDASLTDATDILARAIAINAGLWANDLRVVTGPSLVPVDPLAGPVSATVGSGPVPNFALDVSQLGGMYAGRIHLIGTEQGLGVRNAGVIGATAGDVIVQSNGWLSNSGSLQSSGHTALQVAGPLVNSGVVYAGGLLGAESGERIGNTGVMAAQSDVELSAPNISSALTSVLAAGVNADGILGSQGALTLSASDAVQASGQLLAAGLLSVQGSSISLAISQVSAQSAELIAIAGDVSTAGATLTVPGALDLHAATLHNEGGSLNAGALRLQLGELRNAGGALVQTGSASTTLSLSAADAVLDNTGGVIASNGVNLSLSAPTVLNTDGQILHAGSGTLAVAASTLSDQRGQITGLGTVDL